VFAKQSAVREFGKAPMRQKDKAVSLTSKFSAQEASRNNRAVQALDPEQSASLDDSLDRIMSRRFASQLPVKDRRFLLGLTRTLLAQGGLRRSEDTRC
jgi:hypothetical protein